MDRSAECKCECHTGKAVHVMMCHCYIGDPVLDVKEEHANCSNDAIDDCSCTVRHRDPQCVEHGTSTQGMGALTPPELSWQEGRSPTEIVAIFALVRARDHLLSLQDEASKAIGKELADTLAYMKVRA